jgi:hypothetical protein
MDYGQLIREAWQMTWRHRFLWPLGLLAGGVTGGSYGGGWGGGPAQRPDEPRSPAPPTPGVDLTPADVARWAAENAGLIAAAVAVLALLGLLLLIVSVIAQGGMARATIDLAGGRETTFGGTWRAGRRLFWRFVGLWLLLAAAGLVVAAVVGGFAALVAGLAAAGDAGWPAALVGLAVGLPLVLAGIVAGVVVSIILPYAQRAIAVGGIGPLAALRAGWLVLRAHPGASLLVWLLNLALGIAAGLAIGIAMLAVLVVLGIPGALVWSVAGFGAPTVAYLVVGGLLALAALLTLIGLSNAFFWSYWTLAYLRLAGRPEGQPVP